MMSGNAGANDTLQSTPSIVGLGKGHRPSLAFSVTVIGGGVGAYFRFLQRDSRKRKSLVVIQTIQTGRS